MSLLKLFFLGTGLWILTLMFTEYMRNHGKCANRK